MAHGKHQEGTRLEDAGDAWRFRYRVDYVDTDGKRKSRRPTKYFYKRDHPTEELAQHAAAELMRGVNEANARLNDANPSGAPPQRAVTLAQLGNRWLAEVPAITQGLGPLEVPEGEFQRCRKVTLRNGRLHCEIDKMATYSLAEAYERRLHILLAAVDSDQELIDFVREWGPLTVTDREIALGDIVENSLNNCWSIQREIKTALDALGAFRSGKKEREALMQLIELEVATYGRDSAKETLEHMGKHLGIPGDVLEWAAIASPEGVREGLDYLVNRGLWLSCTLNFVVEQGGRRQVRAGWNLLELDNALRWMIWFDAFTGRPAD